MTFQCWWHPRRKMKSTRFFEGALEKERMGLGFAIATLVSSSGRTPRRASRMIVFEDGSFTGTVGGGSEEDRIRREAICAIKEGKGRTVRMDVRKKGEIEVMIDVVEQKKRAVLFSAGHVARALYEVLAFLGYHVVVVDSRNELLKEDVFPLAERLSSSVGLEIDSNTAIVIFDPERADAIMESIGKASPFYAAVLSSRSRSFSDSRLVFPAGLDIGSERPEEIALSIAGEIEAVRTGRRGGRLCKARNRMVVVRGAGDLATAVAIRLKNAGYNVVALEAPSPTVIRRTVSFAEAVFTGSAVVEGVVARKAERPEDCYRILDEGNVPILVDPEGKSISSFSPIALVDAIIAKRNLGTRRGLAPFVVALGPGFTAGSDCDVCIETSRGHDLGRLIYSGQAKANTGIPGIIAGFGKERVIHSPADGIVRQIRQIGDIVEKNEILGFVGDVEVRATISGRLRGFITPGLSVPYGFKIADIDPRGEESSYLTVSDKARAVAGGVLEAIDAFVSTLD